MPGDAPQGRRSLATRGYVESYERNRICAAPACETTLSRYNKLPLCWRHEQQRILAERRRDL